MAPELLTNVINCKGGSLHHKLAYVTFLAGDGDYVKGVVGLVKGLRKVKTMYLPIMAVLPDVPEKNRMLLTTQGRIVLEIKPIYPLENNVQSSMSYYVINYSKLRAWEIKIALLFLIKATRFVSANLHLRPPGNPEPVA